MPVCEGYGVRECGQAARTLGRGERDQAEAVGWLVLGSVGSGGFVHSNSRSAEAATGMLDS